MELQLTKPLIFFDIESTGLNIASDSIIELCFVKIFPDLNRQIKTWKIRPWDYDNNCQKKMTASASEVTGVKDEDLINHPKFTDVIEEILHMLEDSDLAGYNSAKFDLPLLVEEIERAEIFYKKHIKDFTLNTEKVKNILNMINSLNLHNCRMVDVQAIFHMMEPRNLKAAYRFYCSKGDFENAHTAEADTLATYEVLKGQLDMYQEADDFHTIALKNDIDYLSKLQSKSKSIDFAGRLEEGEDGEAIITFGKHKGKKLREVWKTEPSYIAWVLNGDFTLDTKKQFLKLKKQYETESKAPASSEQINSLINKFNN